jgi:hypothetical protein
MTPAIRPARSAASPDQATRTAAPLRHRGCDRTPENRQSPRPLLSQGPFRRRRERRPYRSWLQPAPNPRLAEGLLVPHPDSAPTSLHDPGQCSNHLVYGRLFPREFSSCGSCDKHSSFLLGPLTGSHQKTNRRILSAVLPLTSSARRHCSALSSWFTRLVRSAMSLFKAIIRLRATMLSSARKKEPSPLAMARPRPLVAEDQRGKGKQAGGQCHGNVARQCCDQDWKKENGERA